MLTVYCKALQLLTSKVNGALEIIEDDKKLLFVWIRSTIFTILKIKSEKDLNINQKTITNTLYIDINDVFFVS